MNNIAEGYERKSNNEFKHFFLLQKVVLEKSGQLHLAKEIEYLNITEYNKLLELSLYISRMLSNFIKKL